MPNPSIADRLESLPLLSKPVLAELWRQLLKTNPPPRMRKELMIRVVAYRLQEQEFGCLHDRSRVVDRNLWPAHARPRARGHLALRS